MEHDLKILKPYLDAINRGNKKFEIRFNDRNYKVGDTLVLNEWNPIEGEYTGKITIRKVKYIMTEGVGFGLEKGYCIMSFD